MATHWTRSREDPGSIPGPVILNSVFQGVPKSLQSNAGMTTHLPSRRNSSIRGGVYPRISARGNRAGQCHWSTGFLGANPLRLQGREIMQGYMPCGKEELGSHGLYFGAMTTSLNVFRASIKYEEQGKTLKRARPVSVAIGRDRAYLRPYFLHPYIPVLHHTRLVSSSSSLKTLMSRATQTSPLHSRQCLVDIFSGNRRRSRLFVGPRWISGQIIHLPPKRAWFDSRRGRSRIFACGNREVLRRLLAGFLWDLPFPPPFHPGAAPYSLCFILVGSQDTFESVLSKRGRDKIEERGQPIQVSDITSRFTYSSIDSAVQWADVAIHDQEICVDFTRESSDFILEDIICVKMVCCRATSEHTKGLQDHCKLPFILYSWECFHQLTKFVALSRATAVIDTISWTVAVEGEMRKCEKRREGGM
ncbi:hypothetical protein PR048_006645 [Dryococelus australis]|uniref:Uncharacterized protein n=1 Tax=Dryococelus australis TaxID=614101 RepID=A0ABQ9IBI6_9NEOP|nr:hypothetical protein PR048_006645 [Dryococelus australis]